MKKNTDQTKRSLFFLSGIIFLLTITTTQIAHAQILNKYGIGVGTSYTTQKWDFKLIPFDPSYSTYKHGFTAFAFGEKTINKYLGIKSELGYIQKGFKFNLQQSTDFQSNEFIYDKNMILHDLQLNTGLKVSPFPTSISPYAIAGIYINQMIANKKISIRESPYDEIYYLDEEIIDSYSKFTMGYFAGLGIEFNSLIYIELTYNPSLTNNFRDKSLTIHDLSWEFKLGVNLNKFLRLN